MHAPAAREKEAMLKGTGKIKKKQRKGRSQRAQTEGSEREDTDIRKERGRGERKDQLFPLKPDPSGLSHEGADRDQDRDTTTGKVGKLSRRRRRKMERVLR